MPVVFLFHLGDSEEIEDENEDRIGTKDYD
jgi:hypothetical protein